LLSVKHSVLSEGNNMFTTLYLYLDEFVLAFCRFRVLDSYCERPLTFIAYFEYSLETLGC